MAANDEAIVLYQKALCVHVHVHAHGYHVYKVIWKAATGKTLLCMACAEPGNSHGAEEQYWTIIESHTWTPHMHS